MFYKQGESVAEFTMDDLKNGEVSYTAGYGLKANWGRGYKSFKFQIPGGGITWVLDQFTITPDADQYGNTILRWADKSNQWFVQ